MICMLLFDRKDNSARSCRFVDNESQRRQELRQEFNIFRSPTECSTPTELREKSEDSISTNV